MIQRILEFFNSIVPHWFLSLLFSVGVFICIGGVCAVLILIISRVLRVKQMQEHGLQITNQGNVRSVYRLKVLPGGAAASIQANGKQPDYKLFMDKVPLVEVDDPTFAIETETGDALPPVKSGPSGGSASAPGIQQTSSGVKKAEKKVSEKSGMVASFLAALGNLLPGSVGNQLKQQGAAVRGVQTKTNQAMMAQDSAVRRVDAVKKGSSNLGGKPAVKPGPVRGVRRTPERDAEPVLSVGPRTARRSISVQPFYYCAQTCEVEPGQSIHLSLQIRSKLKHRSGASYLYSVSSQQIPVQKIERQAEPVLKQGLVYFPAVPEWRIWLPVILSLTIAIGSLLGLVICLALIWS